MIIHQFIIHHLSNGASKSPRFIYEKGENKMAGKGYNPASPEIKEKARAMRKEGQSVESIAVDLGVSTGSVSGWCRDIPARGAQVKKEAPSGRRESKDIMEATAGAKLDTETVDLANRVRKARLQAELDDIDNRKQQRQELDDMRLRERKLLLQLDETRLGASKGDSSVVADLNQLRSELAELREARHQAEIRQIEDRHVSEVHRLEQQIASVGGRTGLSEFDIMSRILDKGENLAVMVTDKVDRLVKGSQGDKQLLTALKLGLSPPEYALLLQGNDEIPSKEDWELQRHYRAHRAGVKFEEAEPGEYEALVDMLQQRNRQWQAVMDKATRAMGQGGSQVVKTSKAGKAPAPGEPEPVVLKAESKMVKCQRCGTTFDVDLNEARQYAARGKKLFVNCPKCDFLLEITGEMIPELKAEIVTKPACFVAGQDGHCNSEMRNSEQCINCHWFRTSLPSLVYD
ncbi:hypothetical protein ES705_05048 [subsurface metagenome]